MYRDIQFRSDGEHCAGRLYIPSKEKKTGAGIVLAHGFAGTMDSALYDYAKFFSDQGFHVLTFDYRGFGLSEGKKRQFISVPMQKTDWRAAIDYMRGLDAVDAGRIGLWGYSFSGGHVLHLATEDASISAVVAQCPHVDNFASMALSQQYRDKKTTDKFKGLIFRDWLGGFIGRTPNYMNIVATEDDTMAALCAPEAVEYFDVAGSSWLNKVALRSFISGKFSMNNAIELVDQYRTPTLLQVADNDQTVSNEAILSFARRVGSIAETKHYPCGHFSIAKAPHIKNVSTDAATFFKHHLIK